MILVNNIRYRYPRGALVYNNFSFTLKENAVYGLFGKNGEGKSTLLKLLAGLIFPQQGSIEVDGFIPGERSPAFLEDIFYLSEEFTAPALKGELFCRRYAPFYRNFSLQFYKRCLNAFNVSETLMLSALSFGQRKKFFIAFALAAGCRYLFLDEPTNGLDIPSKAVFRTLLLERFKKNNFITLVSTHQAHDLEGVVSAFIMLDSNKIISNNNLDVFYESFHIEQHGEKPAAALYAELKADGYRCLMPGRAADSLGRPDLETLFNALLVNGEAVRQALNGGLFIAARNEEGGSEQ
jgi:ABC-2 type transport system ATP-binding protein